MNYLCSMSMLRYGQQRLIDLGLTHVRPTGELDTATRDALCRLQGDFGLPETCNLDAATWAALMTKAAGPLAFSFQPTTGDGMPPNVRLARDASGYLLDEVQLRLRALGYEIGPERTNGRETQNAIRGFQAARHLECTGAVDTDTLVELRAETLGVGAMSFADEEQTDDDDAEIPTPGPIFDQQRRWLDELALRGLDACDDSPQVRQTVMSVIAAANRSFGLRERPLGSAGGPEIEPIAGGFFLPDEELRQWSGLAVSYWLREGMGLQRWEDTPLGRRCASAGSFGRWAEGRGRLCEPRPGSLLVSGLPGENDRWSSAIRVGLVLAVDGDEALTIEGDLSDRVWTTTHELRFALGFVRWW